METASNDSKDKNSHNLFVHLQLFPVLQEGANADTDAAVARVNAVVNFIFAFGILCSMYDMQVVMFHKTQLKKMLIK